MSGIVLHADVCDVRKDDFVSIEWRSVDNQRADRPGAAHDAQRRFRLMKRSRQALVGSNREVGAEYRLRESEEQMRQLAMRLQTAREEERKTLARELHDELGQTLTAIKLELARAVASCGAISLSPRERRSPAVAHRPRPRSVLRRSSASRPICGRRRSIISDWRQRSSGKPRHFARAPAFGAASSAGKGNHTLGPEQEIVLFRIFQESLTNVVRHAQASAVQVRLSRQAGVFELTVRDNGRGISKRQAHDTAAIGLLGMRERAALIGGTFSIAGTPGRGTVVRVTVASKRPCAATVRAGKDGAADAMIRILLVDDHPVVRQGIRTILMERLKGAVVGEAGDADSALRQVRDGDWDVVVADISLPA